MGVQVGLDGKSVSDATFLQDAELVFILKNVITPKGQERKLPVARVR